MNRPKFPIDPSDAAILDTLESGETAQQQEPRNFFVDDDPRDSQARLAGIIDSAMDAIVTVDIDQRILVFNRAAESMFLCSAAEAIGQPLHRFIPERFRAGHAEHIHNFGKTGVSTRVMAGSRPVFGLRSSGEEFPIEASISQVETGGRKLYTVIMRDVTERERAEELRLQSLKDLAEAQRLTHIGSWTWDLMTDTLHWSDELFRIFGLEPAETAPSYAELQADFIHPDDIRLVDDELQKAFATGDSFDFYCRLFRPNRTMRYLHAIGSGVTDTAGKSIRYYGTAQDITELKLAAVAVRESEERYRLLFESNPLPMWVYDLQTLRFLEVNDAAIRHYGYTRDELLSMKITDIRSNEQAEELVKEVSLIDSRLGATKVWKHRKRSGQEISVEVTAHSIDFQGHDARLVLANDVSERQMLEAQLRQSQKMEAIGVLAGGIAHDFNNLLTVINGYSDLLLRAIANDSAFVSNLRDIREAGERAASLTRQLLAFSRKQVLEPKVLDMNIVLTELEKMLGRIIGENIDFRTITDDDLKNISADPSQIEQIIMNLAVNARDAMPNGGKLTIETHNVELTEDYARRHIAVTPGQYVMLAVSDTGIGMDDATKQRIFEPFFSTKDPGHGTGLGLAMVYGIVKQSGGNIWVYSEPGRGTTIKVYLPAVDAETCESKALNKQPVLNGTETVLLVEDEDLVRKLAKDVLELFGYRVLMAASGPEALALCDTLEETIDLLLTDVVMPEMSGRELADHMLLRFPDTAVLYMSGYTDNAIVHQGVIDADAHFVQKPFQTDVLVQKVREVLDSSRNRS